MLNSLFKHYKIKYKESYYRSINDITNDVQNFI